MSTGWVHHMSKYKMKTDGLLAPGNGGRYVTFAEHREKSGSFLILFEVRAQADALIAFMLREAEQDPHCYEVCLGGDKNSTSSIRVGTQGSALAQVDGERISPISYSQFWIKLARGQLSVGTGLEPEQDVFMTAEVPEIPGAAHHHLSVGFAGVDSGVEVLLHSFVESDHPRASSS